MPVKVTRIERDMDFAAAYNAGIAQCHGGLVVLLSNDTIVTEGWLDQLAALVDLDPLSEWWGRCRTTLRSHNARGRCPTA